MTARQRAMLCRLSVARERRLREAKSRRLQREADKGARALGRALGLFPGTRVTVPGGEDDRIRSVGAIVMTDGS